MDRAWLLLLALIAVFYPLSKLNIHLRRIRFTIKGHPHYEELLAIDKRLCKEKLNQAEKLELLAYLSQMNMDAIENGIPVGEEAEFFKFLSAIDLMRSKIESN
jgi:hypothetical protein